MNITPIQQALVDAGFVRSEQPKPMHMEELKAAIRMAGTTPAILADELGVSRSSVSDVIRGKSRSARIESRIAEVVKLPAEQIWPNRPKSLVRRAQV